MAPCESTISLAHFYSLGVYAQQVWTAVARFCIGREESSLIMLVVPLGESLKLKVASSLSNRQPKL